MWFAWIPLLLLNIAAITSAAGPIKVAVIDTGLDLKDPRFSGLLCPGEARDFTGSGIQDVYGHGTHVTGLIKQYAGDAGYCLMILKFYDEAATNEVNLARMKRAYRFAIKHGAEIVNVSAGGDHPDAEEAEILRQAAQVTFIVAAGNEAANLDVPENRFYPASYAYPNVIAVGALQGCPMGVPDEFCSPRWPYSNYGHVVRAWELGEHVWSTLPCQPGQPFVKCGGFKNGTSMATAIHTGKTVRRRVLYGTE